MSTSQSRKASDKALKPSRGRRPQSRDLRAAKDALYREHILDVAESIFAEQGYENTKMKDIASAAGISLGTLYQSYPGKLELYRGLLIVRDNEMMNSALGRAQVLQGLESVEQILWMMQAHVLYLLEHPDYLRIQLQQGYAWYHSAARPSSDEQQLWERGLAMMEQVFNWGTNQGLFVPGVPADQSKLLMAQQQTRLANWVSDGMQEAHDDVVMRVLADFVRQFCRPQVAASMMAEDGGALNAATIDKIRQVGAGA